MTVQNGIDNNLIKISINSKNYEGKLNSQFESKTVQVKELPGLIKSHNYSLITWKDGIRKADNFESASGFTVDVDQDLRLEEAKKRLEDGGFNYIIVTSKSHTIDDNRYHIILFFSNPVYSAKTYGKINEQICSKLFQESDSSVKDAGRFIFGSPNDATVEINFSGKNYNVLAFDGLWDKSLEIVTGRNESVTVDDLDKAVKTSCYCPFHNDSNPSAFTNYNEKSNNWYISCSTCGGTFWMEKNEDNLEERLQNFFHYSTNIIQTGIASGDFYMHPVDKEAYYVLTGTNGNKEEKQEIYQLLVDSRHIQHMVRVDYIGDIEAEENYYHFDVVNGIATVHYSPIRVQKEDNEFIEKYLKDRFCEHKQFIKEYLAMYCYSNYEKLPTLVFNSARGNGKSTFVEMIGAIYPHLSIAWNGIEGNFSYEAEKKFLIVEENDTSGVRQYRAVKKYMGQKEALVSKKYQAPYNILSNMNIAILSNESIPMFAKSSELPTYEKNNQFFVWEFPEFSDPIHGKMRDELESRIGHYIRTELKTVFDGLIGKNADCRYSINVPITDYEKKMFKSSKSLIERDTDEIIEFVYHLEKNGDNQIYYEFVADGLLPQELVKSRLTINHHLIFNNLLDREYILDETDRPMKNGKQYRCYYMAKKFREKFNEAQKTKK